MDLRENNGRLEGGKGRGKIISLYLNFKKCLKRKMYLVMNSLLTLTSRHLPVNLVLNQLITSEPIDVHNAQENVSYFSHHI